jgi:hypothetical protein
MKIKSANAIEGPLYEKQLEDEIALWYWVTVEAETEDGKRFLHSRFAETGRGAIEKGDQFAARVQERGEIDLRYWEEIPEPMSFEERYAPFGPAWEEEQQERMGLR